MEKVESLNPGLSPEEFEKELWARRLISHFSFNIQLVACTGPGSPLRKVLNGLGWELEEWEGKAQTVKASLKYYLNFDELPNKRKRKILQDFREASGKNDKEKILGAAREITQELLGW